MEKEGQSTDFSSVHIPNKHVPDYFVGSNDKSPRRKLSFSEKLNNLLTKLRTVLRNYIKHPFTGKHKVVSISGLIALAIIILIVVLSLTVWRPVIVSEDPSTPEEFATWEKELNSYKIEAKPLTDNEVTSFYSNKIKATKKNGIKYNDLVIQYARELISRAFASRAKTLLDAMDIDNMDCLQIAEYYGAYAYYYFATSNGNIDDTMFNHYSGMQTAQEEVCQSEYPAIEIKEEE